MISLITRSLDKNMGTPVVRVRKPLLVAVLAMLVLAAPGRTQAAWLLSQESIISIIVELAAGNALDAWLDSNRDPQPDRAGADTRGVYYTRARYSMTETYYPWGGNSVTTSQSASQGHENNTSATGNAPGQLKRANLSGWRKRFEILDDQGFEVYRHGYVTITFAGDSSQPFSRDAANAEVVRRWGAGYTLGRLVSEKSESWSVGGFRAESKYSATSPLVHYSLKQPGTYRAFYSYEIADADYSGGIIVPTNRTRVKRYFSLDSHQDDHATFSWCGPNQIITSQPWTAGGVARWVERRTVKKCSHADSGNQYCFGWLNPPRNCFGQWSYPASYFTDGRGFYDQLVTKQQVAPLPGIGN